VALGRWDIVRGQCHYTAKMKSVPLKPGNFTNGPLRSETSSAFIQDSFLDYLDLETQKGYKESNGLLTTSLLGSCCNVITNLPILKFVN